MLCLSRRVSRFRVHSLLLVRSFNVSKHHGDKWKEIEATVSSLRSDSVATAALPLNRKKTYELFMDQKVRLNGAVLSKKSRKVKDGDVLEVHETNGSRVKVSLIRVVEIQDQTAKGKWRVILERKVCEQQSSE